jgi:AraC-like DNA-binding protein
MRTRYREAPAPSDVRAEVVCGWTVTLGHDGLRLLPDGCVDLVWLPGGRVVVCGPETSGWQAALPAGTRALGLRLRPGVAPAVLGLPSSAVREQRVDLTDLWGASARTVGQRIGEAPSPSAGVAGLVDLVRRRLADGPAVDPVARDVALRAATAGVSVSGLADGYGLSARQLHRRCTTAFGYGPSVLARILRFQRFLALAEQPGEGRPSLAVLAAAAGYADQAHLVRESRSLGGAPPSTLLRSRPARPI